MKFHKIQILELASDKIKIGDIKKKVVHIRFSCPITKTELGWGLSWWAAITGLESLIAGHGELAGEGVEGEERRGAGGHGWLCWRWGAMGSSCIGEGSRPYTPYFGSVRAKCCVRKKVGKTEERRKKKMKEKKKQKEEKMWKFFQTWKFSGRKIKDNLWSWSKIIFL
jgi:hypothetical protein